jgi:hypothetical protein
VIDPATILVWSLVVGSTSAGITTAIRALPLVYRWMLERKKPWSCDRCMSFWTVGALSLVLAWFEPALGLSAGPAYPWALWVLRKTNEPHGPPPMPPLTED